MPTEAEVHEFTQLVKFAAEYVNHAREAKAVEVVSKARALSDDEIDALPQMQVTPPSHESVDRSRRASRTKARKRKHRPRIA